MKPEQIFDKPVAGPAYRPFFKFFTVNILTGVITYGIYTLNRGFAVSGPVLFLLALAAAVLAVSGWYILTGKTTIDQQGIRQDWYSPKFYRWSEIMRARVVRLPGSVRLVLHTATGPLKAIHSGNSELDLAFKRIAEFYKK